ncbi:prepilin-type N-terminal cleavage/methylation domain-containing protein [Paenibacillus dendritiformis]|uniref:prepilin-type N-terminal cleavage/methylation domain-containing protein n=1 Tax=Paenibacillus dendritiformis TaxID=130049 RepID=UPI00248CDC00|nr:prepilin-type N-terminal cleavage/methylation domain-containing protein [Paenibacillus dendritiformis]WGU94390.1 prepilin-type N-terminal cleavage/methylation domain-containing protein [Paenibacillus dendritiformis]
MSMARAQERLKAARNEKGMTLIELLAVIVILGIIIAIAAVVIVGQFDKAKETSDKTSVRIITDAVQRYILENPKEVEVTTEPTPISVDTLIKKGYIKDVPKNSKGDKLVTVTVKYASTNDKQFIIEFADNWYTPPKD